MAGARQDLRLDLQRLAFSQAGYFTAAQAKDLGHSYQAQKYHADSGNWIRIDRGLFRLPDWPPGPDDQWIRWTLWSAGRGVVGHQSALAVHGLGDLDPRTVHLCVPPEFGARDPAVTLHTVQLNVSDIEYRGAWAVTTPLRTVIDIASGEVAQEHVDTAVREALALGLTTARRLRAGSDGNDRAALRIERALSLEAL